MALTEKDLLSAIAKLKERNALEANPTERISVAEWKARHAAPSLDATRVEEDSKKVQSKIAESVTKTDGDGLNATMKKVVDEVKKQTEGITKLVDLSTRQLDSIEGLVEKRTDTLGPIEKMMQFASKVKSAITNPKQFALESMSKTMGGVPIVGGVIKKKMEAERDIRNIMRTGKSEEEARKLQPEIRKLRIKSRQASEKYQEELKESGMPEEEFRKLPGVSETVRARDESLAELYNTDPTLKYLGEKGDKKDSKSRGVDREPKTNDEERLIEKLKPETGQEVTFDKQQYRFLGQQWAEVGEHGKTGRMAERGIVKELNRLAGVDPAVNATRKEAGDTGALENLRKAEEYTDEQIEILRKIEENTRPSQVTGGAKARALPAKGKEVSFSGQKYRFQGQQWVEVNEKTGKQGRIAERGIVGELNKRAGVRPTTTAPEKVASNTSFGEKMSKVGGGLTDAAKGVGAIGAALIVLAIGLKAMGSIDFESIAKTTLVIGGLVLVSKLLGESSSSMLKGALGVAALGAAMWVASKGFAAFAEIEWESLAKAGVAIAGLAVGAAAIGGAVGPILLGAAAIAGLGAAVWVLGQGLQAVGEAVDSFVSSIERLGQIDGGNLIDVGAGLAAVAAGMVAFGAANAVAGVTNLVSGFLGAVTPGKTPVEQLLEIAEAGPNIQMAGTGIQSFAEGLTKFSAVDKDKLEIIAKLPNDKIIALGEAIGKTTPQSANAVYGASAENAGAAAVGGGGTTNNVVAPTTVNNTTNQMSGYKPDVRNQDSSFKRMLDARYVPV